MSFKFLANLIALPLVIYGVIIWVAYDKNRGAQMWLESRDAYLASGESLDPAIRFAKPVAARDNFGAIPELDGINLPSDIRTNLESLGLRKAGLKWPRQKRERHEPRSRFDLEAFADYLLETELLELPEDSENLAQDLLASFESSYGETLNPIIAARNRDHAVFLPLNSTLVVPGEMILSEKGYPTGATFGLARGLRLHATLSLRTENYAAAVASIATIFRVAEATSTDRTSSITHLVSVAISSQATAPIWEGLLDRSWHSQQLLELQNALSRIDIYELLRNVFRAELIANLDALDFIERDPEAELAALMPDIATWLAPLAKIYIDHNRSAILSVIDDSIITPARDNASYIDLHTASRTASTKLQERNLANLRLVFANFMRPAFDLLLEQSARAEAELVQAATACALERYFLKHQTYPKGLHSLVPEFIKELPRDPMDNKIMRYQKTDDNRYQLHSIGWDGLDDEGGEGDIVWSYKSQ